MSIKRLNKSIAVALRQNSMHMFYMSLEFQKEAVGETEKLF